MNNGGATMEATSATIIVAVIGFCGSIATTIISNISINRKMQEQIVTGQAVTNVKLEELTKEVTRHNEFAEEIPVMKYRLKQTDSEIANIKSELQRRANN